MAKTFLVSPGRSYTVTASIGSSVKYLNNSTPIVVIGDSGSETFDSTGTEIVVSDDNAKIVQNFSTASVAMDKAAAEQAAQAAQAAQSKAEASAAAAADRVEAAEWALPADYMRFAHVTSLDELAECAPDLRDVEVWRYPLPNLVMERSPRQPMDYYFPKLRKLFLYSEEVFKVWWSNPALMKKRLEELRCVFPKVGQIQYLLSGSGGAEKVWVYAPNAKTQSTYFISAASAKELYVYSKVAEWGKWQLGLGTVEILWYLGDNVKSIDGTIASKLREIHCGFPKATNVNFQVSKLDKVSVLRIVNSLLTYDSATMTTVPTLTLGINSALDGDEEINAALLNAQTAVEDGGKGWNVAVSGFTITPAEGVATMGLRRLVYVKRWQDAEGGYINAAGVRWNVRWGNTVLENWQANEELGFEAFPSVEAALDEWGLRELTMEDSMHEEETEE